MPQGSHLFCFAKKGNRNYVFAYSAGWFNVVSSMLAAILAAVGSKTDDLQYFGVQWNVIIAILAALPVATASALSAFSVRDKISWYWNGKERVNELFAELRDDPTAAPELISKRFTALKLELIQSFPGFDTKHAKQKP